MSVVADLPACRQAAPFAIGESSQRIGKSIQDYFDRWGIEVNHRDEKEILGVGQAQVWNEKSVSKVPALLMAM